ncbi:hypothetical protein [Sphingobacterium sp. MYb382]|uniref:hypothetical protein n=1 Tax=Sphingobacterium sp. MYb382 TaxID=2745278 RepID=UPI0030B775F6
MIPETYEQWFTCITIDCELSLSKAFAKARLSVYEDRTNPETQRFIKLYGEAHLLNIIHWFKQYDNN